MAALKTLVFMVLGPGFVLLYVPYRISSATDAAFDLAVLRYPAVLSWLVGGVVLIRCAWDFAFKGQGTPAPIDPPRVLVVGDLYRFVRNPMYVGAVLVLVGHFLWFQNLYLLLYAAGFFVLFHLFVVFYEEPALRKKFGEPYVRYSREVPRWLPRIRR